MAASDYPRDCLQSLIKPDAWWEKSEEGTIERGRLLKAFVPIPGLTPMTLTPSRAEATDHSKAAFVLEPLRASAPRSSKLPVAALPLNPGEVHAVYKAKHRPVLVIGVGPQIDHKSFGGDKGWQTAPMLMVAPYFGVEGGKSRGGWHPEFVRRIRHAEYPNYVYDQLPDSSEPASILRLDQLQPIGNHHDSYARTEWRLSAIALSIIDEQLRWLTTNVLDAKGLLDIARAELPKLDAPLPSPGE